MTDHKKSRYRETTPFWRDDQIQQNFGDFLTAYLLDRVFMPIPRRPGDIRIIGSYLDDYHVDLADERTNAAGLSQRASLIAWGGGLRQRGGLSNAAQDRVEILSVRGPLTARELNLGDHVPLGDPGYLLPALYEPRIASEFVGKSICIPHFSDDRTDDQIRNLTHADRILRPAIERSFSDLELLVDRLTSSEFVLSGSLHGAILAAAYKKPFAFWDSGCIDIPFKWQDFAESVSIPCRFLPDVESGRSFYESSIKAALTPISMLQALATSPYPIRPDALLKILAHELSAQDPLAADRVKAKATIFERNRHRAEEIISDSSRLIEDLSNRIEGLEVQATEQQTALDHATSRVEDLEAQATEQQVALDHATSRIEDLEAQATDQQVALDHATSRIEDLEAQATDQQVAYEHATRELALGGAQLADELRRTAARPWRPLKRAIQRGALKFALLFEGIMSDRTVTRLRRSLAKRKPRSFTYRWDATVARAWNTPAPVDPLLLPVERKDRAPLGEVVAHRSLRLLAAASAPFSTRRAERFRRSAEKRDPYRLRPESGVRHARLADQFAAVPVLVPSTASRILVADYRIPRPDLSAGEQATFGLIADLCAVGFDVTFLPNDMADVAPYRSALEALGVSVITRESGFASATDYIWTHGKTFGCFYLIRVDVAEALLNPARATAPGARVIFHAPDLYFLRELREAESTGNPAAAARAKQTKASEVAVMQASDHVVLVSPAELPFLAEDLPRSRISVFPALYSRVAAAPAGFAGRKHIFFLGGFKHPPNVQGVKWFADNVWPSVHARLPEAEFHILGAEAPDEVIELGSRPGIRFVGYVEDLPPALAEFRLSVAPLLYGAGIKGKIGMSMGAGVPCVTTMIGAEGMGVVDGVHAAVRDDAEGFAEAVVALYGDPVLWETISQNGRRLVEGRFGDAANQSAFYRTLDSAGALPLDMYVAWCKAAEPSPFPEQDQTAPVEVSIIVPAHNQWAMTRDCLISVQRALSGSGIACEVILADDASTDETLQAATLFPGLRVVRQDRNLGFLGNCNAAAAEARGSALLFLNNDTIVLPGWLTELVRVMREEPSAAIVGSKLLYPDGMIQDAGGVIFADASAANLGRGKRRGDPLFATDIEVDYATGASILVRGEFWKKIGGFDSRFSPAYCEDSDLAMSARLLGMKVVLAANSIVVHFEHGSYGDQVKSTPKELQRINSEKLREKWHSVLVRDHLPPGTGNEIAAMHAQRTRFSGGQRHSSAPGTLGQVP